ncbi:MAG TPA: ABC transporter ATP-binding protein, partial [Pseudonocardiaceae bacterium]|nr:ABC transporter ATP-binding protein [Pseudonocardiaceae bacterium]
ADNIAYPLRVRHRPRADRRAVAERTSAELSLAGLLDRRPAQLSGGQQQRVALARAIAMEADAMLLDEPLSNLDARLRLEARTFLKRLQRELKITTVFVTHDQAEALAMADRIAVMDSGRIRQVGTPREVFGRPADTFVANFIGSTQMNLLDGTTTAEGVLVEDASLPVEHRLAVGLPVRVGIRPEYLAIGSDGIKGTVSVVQTLGVTALVVLDRPGGAQIGVTVAERDEPAVGDEVAVAPRPGRVLLFDAESGALLA